MRTIKNILQTCVIVFFIAPYIASASATMHGPTQYACDSGSGFCLTQNFQVGVTVTGSPADTVDGFGCNGGPEEFWSVMVDGVPSVYYPTSQKSAVFNFSFPSNTNILALSVSCSYLGDGNNAEGNNPALFLLYGPAETRNVWVDMILSGVSELGIGLGIVFLGVIVLVVAVLVFRRGLKWVKLADTEARLRSATPSQMKRWTRIGS